jgi:hypothetical protein
VHIGTNLLKTGGFLQFHRIPVVLSISHANVVVFFEFSQINFPRIHPNSCINHIEESTPKTGKPLPTKDWQLPKFHTDYSPPIHDTGSSKPKESLRYNLARRQLLYSSSTLALMVSTSSRASLNTTSLWCLQIHQKSKMMEIHKSRWVAFIHK